jgi:hypothetical protein
MFPTATRTCLSGNHLERDQAGAHVSWTRLVRLFPVLTDQSQLVA